MVWLGDDVGGQNSMLMSPRMWRQYFKPRMAELIASLRAINPQVKIAYHTDGVIYPIIPDLIEIGLDVLNPVQPASMDPANSISPALFLSHRAEKVSRPVGQVSERH